MSTYNICRFCKKYSDEGKYPAIMYGPRHWAHPNCGLKAKGAAFFDLIGTYRLEQFPYFAAKDTGFQAELEKRIKALVQAKGGPS